MLRARNARFFVLLVLACFPTAGVARTVTEIIFWNELRWPEGIAVDDSGNAYVTGRGSHNAFKITPDGVITEIIDVTGDGMGNTLDGSYGIAVDDSGNAYVTGHDSHNAFKIELCDMLAHYPLFAGCLTGPEGVADPSCACPDDDADGDVDLADFARFQLTFVGP